MILSQEDVKLFYKLWQPLLDYANNKNHIDRKMKNHIIFGCDVYDIDVACQ